MTRIDDRSYYTMRLSQERERAGRVVCSHARAAHLGLAALYADRLSDAVPASGTHIRD